MTNQLPSNIYTDKSLLIIGSGFCIENKNRLNKKIPNVSTLYNLMVDSLIRKGVLTEDDREEGAYDIATVSEFYEDDSELIELLRTQYTTFGTLEYQKNILSHTWKKIYTTNYDDVIESALTNNNIKYRRYCGSDNLENHPEYINIIHLNGMIGDMNTSNFLENVKLTNSSYLKNSKNYDSWIQELELDIRNSEYVFCLGFSGDSDPKIAEKLAMFKEKVYMINGENIGKIQEKKMSSKGNVIPYTVEQFNEYLSKHYKKNIIPYADKKTKSLVLTKYHQASIDNIKTEINDVHALISRGIVDENKIFHESKNYLVKRDIEEKIIEKIDSGYKLIEIHSNLGNGKTIFLKQLKAALSKIKQYNVYEFQGDAHEIPEDIKIINAKTKQGDKNIIIIDDFHMLETYFYNFNKISNAQFIVSVRSSIFDNISYKLEKALECKTNDIITFDINDLSNAEINQYKNILRNHNIDCNFRKRYVNFINLITETIEINNLLKKLKEELDLLLKDNKKSYPIIAYFCLNLMEYSDSNNLKKIANILDIDINSRYITSDTHFNEFIESKKNYKPTLKSPIVMQQLLHHIDIEIIRNVLTSIMNGLECNKQNNDYYTLQKLLISYSNLNIIFRDNESIEKCNDKIDIYIGNFYKEIQNSSFCKRNPFFWLNYAIQQTNIKEYPISKIYLDNAEKYAKKKNMLPFYQLNGQRARLCFLEAKKELETAHIDELKIDRLIAQGIDYIFKDHIYKENNIFYQYKEIKLLCNLYTDIDHKKLPISLKIKHKLEESIMKIESIINKLNSSIEREKLMKIKNNIQNVLYN